MKFASLKDIICYMEQCPLTLCAVSPWTRMAVELRGGYEYDGFHVYIEEGNRYVVMSSPVLKDQLSQDEEAVMDWWLVRRETCLPINLEENLPYDAEDGLTLEGNTCNIHVSDILPIVQTMAITSIAGSLSWVHQCALLESLDVPECLYPINFSGFRSLVCLKKLRVNYCNVYSFEGISGCVNLEELDVSYCTGTGDYSPIGRCSRLKELDIDGCNTIRDFSWIGQLKALTDLYINDVELGDMGWIAGCISMKNLSMARSLCEDYHPITTLKTLGRLSWCGNDVSAIQWTKSMDSLQTVDVRSAETESRITVVRGRYPDAKTWCDVLQACGAFKRRNSSSDSNNSIDEDEMESDEEYWEDMESDEWEWGARRSNWGGSEWDEEDEEPEYEMEWDEGEYGEDFW